jgi:hypothetical protein
LVERADAAIRNAAYRVLDLKVPEHLLVMGQHWNQDQADQRNMIVIGRFLE